MADAASATLSQLNQARPSEQGLVNLVCFGGLSLGVPASGPLAGCEVEGCRLVSFLMQSSVTPFS